ALALKFGSGRSAASAKRCEVVPESSEPTLTTDGFAMLRQGNELLLAVRRFELSLCELGIGKRLVELKPIELDAHYATQSDQRDHGSDQAGPGWPTPAGEAESSKPYPRLAGKPVPTATYGNLACCCRLDLKPSPKIVGKGVRRRIPVVRVLFQGHQTNCLK